MGSQSKKAQLNDIEGKPAGLVIRHNFISLERHGSLLRDVNCQPWRTDLKRRVQHYGWRYDYKARSISRNDYLGFLPDWLGRIAENLKTEGFFEVIPDQAIVNEYQPGQGIGLHVDCEPCFGNTVASLSLGSRCIMNFEHGSGDHEFETLLEPCSMIVMSGSSRFDWKHGIAARTSDLIDGRRHRRERRVSITFRTVNV